MKKIRTSFLLIPAVSACLFSCISPQKIASDKTDLKTLDVRLDGFNDNLKKMETIRRAKQESNQIDDTANARIQKFIQKTNAEIDTLIDGNNLLVNGNIVNKQDWEKLKNALSTTSVAAQKIQQKVNFLEDLLNRNMVVKLDQDVLFDPGSYSVSSSIVSNIGKLFEPAAAEIDRFTKKYPDFALSLVITLKGYADATTISEGSTLYNNLKTRLSMLGREPDSHDLNKELSNARAEQVKKLFEKFATTRSDNGIYKKNIFYIYEGKGEQLPDPKVADYTVNDPRRRIVLLFWSIFPD